MKVLKGNKVILRPINYEDTDYIVKWRNTDFVRNNFIYREELTNKIHEKWMKSKVKTGEVIQYIIMTNENIPIGSVYYRDISNDSAEFGIFIGEKEYMDSGMGQEAMNLFIDYGFDKLRLNIITLRVIADNKKAYHIYEKMGFKVVDCEVQTVKPTDEKINVIFMRLKSNLINSKKLKNI